MAADFPFRLLRPPDRWSTFVSHLVSADNRHIVLRHVITPSRPLVIDDEEVMGSGYDVDWFLFKGEPYDIGRVHRPDGVWTGWYVDILEPVRWTGADPSTLEPLVDLFLDIWITPTGEYHILDEDEFKEAERLGHISEEQAAGARAALERVRAEIESGVFPPAATRQGPM